MEALENRCDAKWLAVIGNRLNNMLRPVIDEQLRRELAVLMLRLHLDSYSLGLSGA
jgi:hypothetical protein